MVKKERVVLEPSSLNFINVLGVNIQHCLLTIQIYQERYWYKWVSVADPDLEHPV
jgi:hypothetical protein